MHSLPIVPSPSLGVQGVWLYNNVYVTANISRLKKTLGSCHIYNAWSYLGKIIELQDFLDKYFVQTAANQIWVDQSYRNTRKEWSLSVVQVCLSCDNKGHGQILAEWAIP